MNDDEEVPIFSQADVTASPQVTPQDENDFSTLVGVQNVLNDAERKCTDMSSLDLAHPTLSAAQQIFAYQFALDQIIRPAQAAIKSTIDSINGKYREDG